MHTSKWLACILVCTWMRTVSVFVYLCAAEIKTWRRKEAAVVLICQPAPEGEWLLSVPNPGEAEEEHGWLLLLLCLFLTLSFRNVAKASVTASPSLSANTRTIAHSRVSCYPPFFRLPLMLFIPLTLPFPLLLSSSIYLTLSISPLAPSPTAIFHHPAARCQLVIPY